MHFSKGSRISHWHASDPCMEQHFWQEVSNRIVELSNLDEICGGSFGHLRLEMPSCGRPLMIVVLLQNWKCSICFHE